MKNKTRFTGIVMSILMVITMIPSFAFADDLPFKDVPSSEWYYNDVKEAYDTGLINGMTDTTFEPASNMTYAQAVKLAACMNQKYSTGSVTLSNGSPNWWDSYVAFAKEKNIISKDYDWNSNATRTGYVEIFAKALPEEALKAKNSIADNSIPDVAVTHPQASAIYKLYRAGILIGMDEKGTFEPDSNIKRSEVSAILTRMMNESARKELTLEEITPPDTPGTSAEQLTIVKEPLDVEMIEKSAVLSITVSGEFDSIVYEWQKLVAEGWRDASTLNSDDATYTINNSALHIVSQNGTEGYGQYRCIVSAFNKGSLVAQVTSRTVMVDPQAEPMKALLDRGDSAGRRYYYFYHTGHDTGELDPETGGRLWEETIARIFKTYNSQERFQEATKWIVGEPEYMGPPEEEAIAGFWIKEGPLAGGPYSPSAFQDTTGAYMKNENGEYVTTEVLLNCNYYACRVQSVSGGKGPYTYTWYLSKDRFGNDYNPLIEGTNCLGQGTENIWVWPFEPGKGMDGPHFMGFLCCRVTDSKGRTTNACYYQYDYGRVSYMHTYQMLYALYENSAWIKNADDCIDGKPGHNHDGNDSSFKCRVYTSNNYGIGRWW